MWLKLFNTGSWTGNPCFNKYLTFLLQIGNKVYKHLRKKLFIERLAVVMVDMDEKAGGQVYYSRRLR